MIAPLHEQTEFLRELGKYVREQVELAVKPYQVKIEELEAQILARPIIDEADVVEAAHDAVVRSLPAPKEIDMCQVAELVEHERASTGEALLRISDVIKQIQDHLEKLPKPENGKDGAPGAPGKDVDYTFVKSLIDEQVEIKVRQLPPPRDGKDGVNGADGKSAEPVDYVRLTEIMRGLVPQYFEANPVVVRDGEPGAPGKDGISVDPDDVHRIIDGLFTSAHDRLSNSYNSLIEKINARLAEVKDGAPGEPGKDAEPVNYSLVDSKIHERVQLHFEKNPVQNGKDGAPGKDGEPGRDGKNATEVDYDKLKEIVGFFTREYFEINPIQHGRDGVDGAPGKDGEPGVPGAPGKDAEVNYTLVWSKIHEKVQQYFEDYPVKNGVDGKDAVLDFDKVATEVNDQVIAYFETNPVRNGEDGAPGKDGTSVTIDQLVPLVTDTVSKVVAGLPKSPHITGSVIDRDGVLNFMYSDGSSVKVGTVVGRDGTSPSIEQIRDLVKSAAAELPRPKDGENGKDGKDGRDGVGFEDIRLEQIDSRNARLVVTNSDGSKSKEFPLTLLGQDYRGMYDETAEYVRGDRVTLGGSEWHCNVPCKGIRPITDSEHWSLAVKRGRDGKQGNPGPQGEKGIDGRDGRDLTQLGFDGSKT